MKKKSTWTREDDFRYTLMRLYRKVGMDKEFWELQQDEEKNHRDSIMEDFALKEYYEEAEAYWSESKKETRAKIQEFYKEIDSDWAHSRRAEYFHEKAIGLAVDIHGLEKLKKKVGIFFIYGGELSKARKDYKNAYVMWGMEKVQEEKKDSDLDESQLEALRQIPIKDLIGVQVLPAGGGRYKACCPIHKEKTPSFVIYPDNSAHCFGCGAHPQNAIDFMMMKENMKFIEALNYLKHF